MGEEGLQTTAKVWRRNEMRTAMLVAARRIVESEGLDALSLDRVAEDTSLMPVAVYACFPSKTDLIGSIFADDLAQLACAMREGFPFSPEPEIAAPDTPVENAVVQFPVDTNPDAAEDAARKARAARVRALVKKDIDQTAEIENGEPPARVDAWLERRLRVFERTLADVETRLAEAERNSLRAVGFAEDTTKFVGEHVEAANRRNREDDDLGLRIAASEKRQRDMMLELRAEVKDSACRLEAVEAAVTGSRVSEHGPAAAPAWQPENETPAEPEYDVPHSGEEAAFEDPEPRIEPAVQPETPETFLSAARRAANAAATLSRIEEDTSSDRGSKLIRSALIGGGALVLLLGVAGFVMHSSAGGATRTTTAAPQSTAPAAGVNSGTTHKRLTASAPALPKMLALANEGNPKAQVVAALAYLNGNGVPKSNAQAALLLQRAATGGDAVAQYWLATLFTAGTGVASDPRAALRWYEAAAMQGNRKAMHALAMAYAEGLGTDKNPAEAARWFSQAAQMGLVNSQFNLAVLYERGQGLPQSLLDAYKWYAVAAAQGDVEAAARVDALATQLSPDDLDAAKQAAAAFKPSPLNTATNVLPRADDFAGG